MERVPPPGSAVGRSEKGTPPEGRAEPEGNSAVRLHRRLYEALRRGYDWKRRWQRQRRRLIRATIVLGVLSVPTLVLSLVALPHVFRSPVVRGVILDSPGGPVPSPDSPDFPSAVAMLTGAALEGGNRIEILANGDRTYPRLWNDLRVARRSIVVENYYVGPGAVLDSLTRILAERARAGVAAYFLYDAFGAQRLPEAKLTQLRRAGVHTAAFRPLRWYAPDRANHRLHVRAIVIDGTVGYTGGFGFDDKWLGAGRTPAQWRETNARLVGPAVTQLQSGFVARWAVATGGLLLSTRLLRPEPVATSGGEEAAVIQSPSVVGSSAGERLFALSVATAARRLYLTNAYFVPGEAFVRLLEAAARRGVDVRILTNGRRSDVRVTWLAGRSTYERLLRAGVRVYEYQPSTLHAKTLVADGVWSVVTTMNFDNRSLAYNDELALVTLDHGTGATMDSLFLADLPYSQEIHIDSFLKRPWTQRLLERGARLLAGLL